MQFIKDIETRIRYSGTSGSCEDFNINGIHAIYYCVNYRSNRYQQDESKFVMDLHSVGVPFIIVITQCLQSEEEVEEFERIIARLNRNSGMNDIHIVSVLAQDYKVRGTTIPALGLENPKGFVKNGFIAAQRINTEHKRELAVKILRKYVRDAWSEVWSFKGKFITIAGVTIPFLGFGASGVLNATIRNGDIESFEDVGINEFGKSDQSAPALAMFEDAFISAITSLWH